MKQEQEVVVITKTYDLILWTCTHTNRFPRNQRFVLGERIERGLYDSSPNKSVTFKTSVAGPKAQQFTWPRLTASLFYTTQPRSGFSY